MKTKPNYDTKMLFSEASAHGLPAFLHTVSTPVLVSRRRNEHMFTTFICPNLTRPTTPESL